MTDRSLALIIVAAGSSRRMSGADKVWSDLGGHPVVWHSLARMSGCARETILVVKAGDVSRAHESLSGEFPTLSIVIGGAERQLSVHLGLRALSVAVEAVAVHDAARPFAAPELLDAGYEALRKADGAIPVIEVADTIKRIDLFNRVVETVDRSSLRAAQTPQVFQLDALRMSHDNASATGSMATDDASLLEQSGYRVLVFPGSRHNIKITTLHDLDSARAMLSKEEA